MLVYVQPSNEALLRRVFQEHGSNVGVLLLRFLSLFPHMGDAAWRFPNVRGAFSPAHPLGDICYPPYPPIVSQSISRDVPVVRARGF